MGRKKKLNPRCAICGKPVAFSNVSNRCQPCAADYYCPTPEEIREGCLQIQQEWIATGKMQKGDEDAIEARRNYSPKIYKLPRGK